MSLGIVFPGDMSPGKSSRGKLEGDSFLDNFPWRHHGAHTGPPNFQSTNLVPRWTLFPGDMSPGIVSKEYLSHYSWSLRIMPNLLLELLVASFELIDIGSVIASRHGDIEDVLASSRQNPTNTGNVPALLAPGSKYPGSLPAYDRALCLRCSWTTSSDSSMCSLIIGVLNPIIPLQRRLVVHVDLAKMLIDAFPDFWPKLGLHVGLQVKLGLQSYITKTDLEI
ncbi:hypothetical protein Tco_0438074 [Tanacetum coccineum]